LTLDGLGGFRLLAQVSYGSWVGSWHTSSADAMVAIGNFDGVAGDELFTYSPWGIGFFRLSGSVLVSENLSPYGTWLGSWNLGAADRYSGHGDLDGDGRDDIVLKSPWGIGVLGRDSYGTLRATALAAYGTWQGSWNLGAADQILAVGNFGGDGNAD